MRELYLKLLLFILCFSLTGISVAQDTTSEDEIKEKLLKIYSAIKNPEISFDRFYEVNAHVYANQSKATGTPSVAAALPTDTYCSKVRNYCDGGTFENVTAVDQNLYTGSYGLWSGYIGQPINLYPNPFTLTYGFVQGGLDLSTSHQTIVNKSAGTDPTTGISLVPGNGMNQSLRLGNRVDGYGTEMIGKTITVNADETILNFWYAVVFEDPGHPVVDQPAFSVRVYDCATGSELSNVCNLGNNSNIAVSNANNPFFKSLNNGAIAYRDWTKAQINLSAHIGKTVTIIFTNKDCGQGAHWGYTYLDNLFSDSKCVIPDPGGDVITSGDVNLDTLHTSTCGTGNICVKYKLPFTVSSTGVTTFGYDTILLSIYQNSTLIRTITSPRISTYTPDSTYCFGIDPASLGINTALGGFDYAITGKFTASTGFILAPITRLNPPTGRISGVNNDYLVTCPSIYYSKPVGDLHSMASWGLNPDGSGANPPDFGAGKTFVLANRAGSYQLTANWTVGGILTINGGSVLQIGNYTLAIADRAGTGLFGGTINSNLIVNQPVGGGTPLGFAAGANNLNNLGIASSATTTLTSSLNLYGVLTVQSGTFSTGNVLTLKSTATNTARVAPVTGTITGTVTVERYIPARRAWRMVSAPVGGSQTINSAWQEGATTSSANPDPSPGYGTHVTEGAAVNGWDHNPLTAMISIKRYVSATDTWNPLANTNATAVGTEAYLLFVRGDRSIPLGLNTVPANNTTLRATGALKTGDQTFTVNATGFTAIPNPFASPINFATITRNNVQNNFYLWDPKLGGEYGVGAYVLLSYNGSSYDVIPASVSPESQYIQSGQGFLVHSTGSAGSLVIKEADKSATAAADVFSVGGSRRTGNGTPFADVPLSSTTPGLRINLQSFNKDNTISLLDEVFSSYGDNFSDKVDNLDAQKIPNVEENLAIIRDKSMLMVDRSRALEENDLIQLQLWHTTAKPYVLEFNPVGLNTAMSKAYLVDHYLKTSTPIDLHKVSQIYFNINADAASANPERFTIAFREGSDAPIANGKMDIMTYPNPVSGKNIRLLFNNQPQGTYKAELVNGLGQVVHREQIQHGGGSSIQHIQLANTPASGIYLLNITNSGIKKTLKIVVNQAR
ncbi:MAG: T9SS type A sorting domain-containing protein [Williamsia sp.]|nr:T9SS type A sorting domain-containing protein [Williamsia sp.]